MTWKSSLNQLAIYMKLRFMRTLTYRIEILTWILLDFFPFFVLFMIWNAIYAGSNAPTALSISSVIFYYLAAFLIQGVTSVHFEGWRSEEIRLGKIDFFMTRPFSYLQELTLADIGSKLVYLSLFVPLFILLTLFTQAQFSLATPELTLTLPSLFTLIVLLLAGYTVQLALGICITLGTFWLEGSSGLEHFKNLLLTLFTGSIMPIAVMPDWLAQVTQHSPLRFLYYLPIMVLTEGYQLGLTDWIELSVLLVCCVSLVQLIWKRGVYHYASAGGG